MGGPIGAIIGFALGKALFDKETPRLEYENPMGHRGPYRNTFTQGDVNAALLVLIAAVMKADGTVQRSELDYVKRFLLRNYGEEQATELLHALRDIVKQDIPVNQVCMQIKVSTDYTTRYHMIDFLFGIAAADQVFTKQEELMLRTIATHLGINAGDFASMSARYAGSYQYGGKSSSASKGYGRDPYKVLGITSEATDDEIKKAYRRLAMKYHPDKVESMGEEMRKNAEAQFREINEAYEQVKSLRGIK